MGEKTTCTPCSCACVLGGRTSDSSGCESPTDQGAQQPNRSGSPTAQQIREPMQQIREPNRSEIAISFTEQLYLANSPLSLARVLGDCTHSSCLWPCSSLSGATGEEGEGPSRSPVGREEGEGLSESSVGDLADNLRSNCSRLQQQTNNKVVVATVCNKRQTNNVVLATNDKVAT